MVIVYENEFSIHVKDKMSHMMDKRQESFDPVLKTFNKKKLNHRKE